MPATTFRSPLIRNRSALKFGTALATCVTCALGAQAAMGQAVLGMPVLANDGGATINADTNNSAGGFTRAIDLGNANRVITWQQFSVADKNVVDFRAADTATAFTVVNRVVGDGSLFYPSLINGTISSGAKINVWLINPAGVTFGASGAFSGGSLAISTLDIDDPEKIFGADPYTLTFKKNLPNGLLGTVDGATPREIALTAGTGEIEAQDAVVVIGEAISSGKNISAAGAVSFISGSEVTITPSVSSPLSYTIDKGTRFSGVELASGTITGHNIVLAAVSLAGAKSALLKVDSGATLAATLDNGTIELTTTVTAETTDTPGGDGLLVAGALTADHGITMIADGKANITGALTTTGNGAAILVTAKKELGITGAVSAKGDYTATGAEVTLGKPGLTQTADGLAKISATGKDKALTVQGNLKAVGDITLDSKGDILLANASNGTVHSTGGSIALTATAGSVLSAASPTLANPGTGIGTIDGGSSALAIDATGDLAVNTITTTGALTLTKINGDLHGATGSGTVRGGTLVADGAGQVTITAQNVNLSAITADKVAIRAGYAAVNAIAAGDVAGIALDKAYVGKLTATDGNLTLTATSTPVSLPPVGDFYEKATTLTGASVTGTVAGAAQLAKITATGGNITFTARGVIADEVRASQDVAFKATESIATLGFVSAGDDYSVEAKGNITLGKVVTSTQPRANIQSAGGRIAIKSKGGTIANGASGLILTAKGEDDGTTSALTLNAESGGIAFDKTELDASKGSINAIAKEAIDVKQSKAALDVIYNRSSTISLGGVVAGRNYEVRTAGDITLGRDGQTVQSAVGTVLIQSTGGAIGNGDVGAAGLTLRATGTGLALKLSADTNIALDKTLLHATAGSIEGTASKGALDVARTVAGGAITYGAGTTAAVGAIEADGNYTVAAKGKITLGRAGAFTQSAKGAVSISSTGGDIASGQNGLTLAANVGNSGAEALTLTARAGAISLGDAALTAGQDSDAVLRAANGVGFKTLTAGHDARLSGGSITATGVTAQKGLILGAAAAIDVETSRAVKSSVTYIARKTEAAAGTVALGTVEAGTSYTVDADGTITLGRAGAFTQSAKGAVSISSTGGDIASGQNGLTLAANADDNDAEALALTAKAGAISLGDAALTAGQDSDAVLRAANGVGFKALTAGHDARLSGGSITATGVTAQKGMISGSAGSIDVGRSTAAGSVGYTARTGAITLGTVDAGTVTLDAVAAGASGDIKVTRITSAGTVAIKAGDLFTLDAGGGITVTTDNGTIGITAADAALDSAIAADRITLTDTGANALRIGDDLSTSAGFALSAAEVALLGADEVLTLDGGTHAVSVGKVTFGHAGDVVVPRTDVRTKATLDVLGAVTAAGITNLAADAGMAVGGTIGATGTLDLTSGARLDLTGGIDATGDLALTAGGAITVGGSGSIVGSGTQTLTSEAAITIGGTIGSGGTLAVSATGPISIDGTITGDGTQRLTSAGRITIGGTIGSVGTLAVAAAGPISIDGTITANGTQTLDSRDGIDVLGTILADGRLSLDAIKAIRLGLGGLIGGGGDQAFRSKADITIAGKITGTGTRAFTSPGTIGVTGAIDFTGDLLVDAAQSLKVAGTIRTDGTQRLKGGRAITVDGELDATGTLVVTTPGDLTVNGTVSLRNDAVGLLETTGAAGKLLIGEKGAIITTQAGLTLQSAGALTVAGNLGGSGTQTLTAGTDLDVTGKIQADAGSAATLTAGKLIRLRAQENGSKGVIDASGADLTLDAAKILVGQDTGFGDAILGGGKATDPATINRRPDSALYFAGYGGQAYVPGVELIKARTLTVRFKDFALFQNTGKPRVTSGVTVGSQLVLDYAGDTAKTPVFAMFGTINGTGNSGTAQLGDPVIQVNFKDFGSARINGCVIGGGSCLSVQVVTPTINGLDRVRGNIFFAAPDFQLPFDPVVGTNNDALFGDVGTLGLSNGSMTPIECSEPGAACPAQKKDAN